MRISNATESCDFTTGVTTTLLERIVAAADLLFGARVGTTYSFSVLKGARTIDALARTGMRQP